MIDKKTINGRNCFKNPPNDKNLALKNTRKHNLTMSHFRIPKFTKPISFRA